MRALDGFKYHSSTATNSASFTLHGGLYGVTMVATWNAGSIALQILSADGSTYVTTFTAPTANSYNTVYLPPGTYQLAVTSATALYVAVSRIPFE